MLPKDVLDRLKKSLETKAVSTFTSPLIAHVWKEDLRAIIDFVESGTADTPTIVEVKIKE